jgi:hypothetical protein
MKTNVRENQMETSNRKNFVFAAILACLIVAASASAFAAPPVLRNGTNQTFTGVCCTSYNEEVGINEPAAIVPVVVTFSSDYRVNAKGDQYHAGLSVNGGPCLTLAGYGPQVLADAEAPEGIWSSATMQWVVEPTDGVLVKGENTFALCGGGLTSSSDSITIGQNTLSVAKY